MRLLVLTMGSLTRKRSIGGKEIQQRMRENNELSFGHTKYVLLGHLGGVSSREQEQMGEESGEEKFSV